MATEPTTENTSDELTLLTQPGESLTVRGRTFVIKTLLIEQLPKAVDISAKLFGDPDIHFDQSDFYTRLKPAHIELMKDLLALVVDAPRQQLSLPIVEFLTLFDKALNVNHDFFLMTLTTLSAPRPGPTSSSYYATTVTPSLNS